MLQHATAVTYVVFRQRREDVAQEAVIKGLEGLEGFRGESLFSTWFHAVALNHARTRLRQEIVASREEAFREELLEKVAILKPADWPLQLRQLVEFLDPEEQALVQDKLEGRVESELAEKYSLTPEGIRSRWDAIKKKLRRKIG